MSAAAPDPDGLRPFRAGISDPDGLRPFRAGIWFGGFNGVTWMIGLGTPMVLMAEQFGADAFRVGLASAFVFLLLPVQVLATSTLARLGYRRQMVLGWGIRALFLLVPLGLALAAPADPAPWMVDLLVASVFGFCFFRAFGVAAHVPWLAAILPISVRGRFFATEGVVTSVVGVATLLLCSTLFTRLPGHDAFAIVYVLAMAGSALAIASLFRLPGAPPPAPVPLRSLHRELRSLWFDRGAFRFYLALSLLGSVVGSSLGAFTTYYLRAEVGLPAGTILAFTAAQFAGQIAGGWSIRLTLDRAPLRRFFRMAALGVAAVQALWLAYVAGVRALEAWLPVVYFGLGAASGIHQAAHSTYLPELSSAERRPVAIAVFTATLGVLAGLAPMAWGLALQKGGSVPGVDAPRFALFFALGIASQLLLLVLYGRIRHGREQPGHTG
jgi:hypothetical protein